MTTKAKEKNSELLSGKVKPSQKEYVEHAIVGPNGEKLQFNEVVEQLITAHKEQKRKAQENKVQITSRLERINQYNTQINEIIKSIATDSEQLVELNNEDICGRIDELKKIDEINQDLVGKNAEISKVNETLTIENKDLQETVGNLKEAMVNLDEVIKEKENELISLKADFNRNSERVTDLSNQLAKQIDASNRFMDTKNELITELRTEIEDLKREINTKETEIANTGRSLTFKEEEVTKLNNDIARVENDKKYLQGQVEDLRKDIVKKDETISNKDRLINEKVEEYKDLLGKHNDSKTELISKVNEIEKLKAEHKQAVKELEESHDKALDKAVETTTKEFEEKIVQEANRHSEELALIQKENKRINNELMELQASVETDYIEREKCDELAEKYKELVAKHNSVINALQENNMLDKEGNLIIKK